MDQHKESLHAFPAFKEFYLIVLSCTIIVYCCFLEISVLKEPATPSFEPIGQDVTEDKVLACCAYSMFQLGCEAGGVERCLTLCEDSDGPSFETPYSNQACIGCVGTVLLNHVPPFHSNKWHSFVQLPVLLLFFDV